MKINMTDYLAFNEECWSRLTDNVVKGNYVLVIGSESMLDKDSTGGVSDSKLFFERLRRERCHEEDDFADMSKYDQILEVIKAHSFESTAVSGDLRNILGTKCFRVVLTVNYDPYLEVVMREIWGNELRVLDIFGEKGTDFDISDITSPDEFFDVKPTLYYVFGKADPERVTKRFSVTDNDSIEVIAQWMNSSSRPSKLMNYLKRKELLSIGCRFSDWYFRFFWYCLRGDVSRLKYGQVAMTFNVDQNSVSADADLVKYLKTQKVYTFPNAAEFQKILSSRLMAVKDSFGGISNYGGVFISYASEESAMAALIFSKLKEKGFNVWMDSRKLFGGSSYDDRIATAIGQCKLFLPILSRQVKEDILSGNTDRYYLKEWKLAHQRLEDGSTSMIPVVLVGYDTRSEYHHHFEEETARRTVFEFTKSPLSDLFELVKKALQDE